MPLTVLETITYHRLQDDEAKIIIMDLVHIPLHTCQGVS
jgi:predicted metallopeptidase